MFWLMFGLFGLGVFVGTRLGGRGVGNVQQRIRDVEREAYERGRAYERGVQEGRDGATQDRDAEPIDVQVLNDRN
jgi:hypothetical protein